LKLAKDLNELIRKYGPAMAVSAEAALKPLHDPAVHAELDFSVVEANRSRMFGKPFRYFPSQRSKMTALVKGYSTHRRLWLIAEPGCGKSPMSLGVAFHLFKHKPDYRALVLCPGHIVRKWRREVEWAVPNVLVRVIRNFAELLKWKDAAARHDGPAYAVISKETAKLGFDVDRPCAARRKVFETIKQPDGEEVTQTLDAAACPSCGTPLRLDEDDPVIGYYEYLRENTPARCLNCGDKLATNARGYLKTPHIDRYIQRKMKGFFDFLIADEVHELAGADTIQGNTFGTLAAACTYTLALTGTLIGGKAEDLHAPLWRMSPALLRQRGFDLKPLTGGKIGPIGRNARNFIERYGVLEHLEIRSVNDDIDSRVERGACGRKKSYKTTEHPRPGISPDLYNHFLIGRAVFMSLSELGPALPTLERVLVGCKMSEELRQEYDRIDAYITAEIKEKSKGGGKGPPVLSTIRIQVLDAYSDKPWGWDPVMCPDYDQSGTRCGQHVVVTPRDLGLNRRDDKDEKLLKICQDELADGRRCCIYPVFTGKHDVRPKIQEMLVENGIRAVILPDTIQPAAREDWILKHCAEIDVLIVHPKRVMTGLDLIQFPSLIWYQVGYSTHVLRQASARARRPIQTLPCKVFYLYNENSIQSGALALMGEKESASQALEGTFDVDALKNMMNGGENDDIMAALAHSIGRSDVKSAWAKVDQKHPEQAPEPEAQTKHTAEPSRRRTAPKPIESPCLSKAACLIQDSLFGAEDFHENENAPSLFDLVEVA